MGLFTPKISSHQMHEVQARFSQLQDSVKLVNTTVKPDIFFKRLNLTLDLLLQLQAYEKYKIFKGALPSADCRKILNNLEATVDDFIDRALAANRIKMESLKTEKARKRNYEKFITELISAFDVANTFWLGSRGLAHYSGPLYTPKNYQRVKALWEDFCNSDS